METFMRKKHDPDNSTYQNKIYHGPSRRTVIIMCINIKCQKNTFDDATEQMKVIMKEFGKFPVYAHVLSKEEFNTTLNGSYCGYF